MKSPAKVRFRLVSLAQKEKGKTPGRRKQYPHSVYPFCRQPPVIIIVMTRFVF